MLKFLVLIMLFAHFETQGACEDFRVLHGLVNLKQKTWETTYVNKKVDKVCKELPKPPRSNIEITITKEDKNFVVLLYRPLLGYWDGSNHKNKKHEAHKFEIKHLPIETYAPAWYKGASITVREMPSRKVIVHGKL